MKGLASSYSDADRVDFDRILTYRIADDTLDFYKF